MALGMNSQVIFLESFVESTVSLPPELQRILNTIKALDERCSTLSDATHSTVQRLLRFPSRYNNSSTAKAASAEGGGGGGSSNGGGSVADAAAVPPGWTPEMLAEYNMLTKRLEEDQRLLAQFADEKVALASQAHDVLELHALNLEQYIQDFEGDLNASGLGLMDGLMDTAPSFSQLPTVDSLPRGRLSGVMSFRGPLDDWGDGGFGALNLPSGLPPSFGSLTPQPSFAGAPKRSLLGLPGGTRLGPGGTKRPRDSEVAGGSGGPVVQPGSGAMGFLKRRGGAFGVVLPPVPGGGGLSVPFPPILTGAGGLEAEMLGAGGFEEEPAPQVFSFLTPPPPGLCASAGQPQCAGGRFLYHEDITTALEGRHAELYWPDDASWYLIEIQQVDVATCTAQIVYSTGESEKLDLREIAAQQHMMLVPPEAYI